LQDVFPWPEGCARHITLPLKRDDVIVANQCLM
jgi:hypothetical protein